MIQLLASRATRPALTIGMGFGGDLAGVQRDCDDLSLRNAESTRRATPARIQRVVVAVEPERGSWRNARGGGVRLARRADRHLVWVSRARAPPRTFSGMGSQPDDTVKGQPNEVVTAEEFSALVRELSNWDRWGPEDQRGALHFLTAERIAAAAGLVRDGVTVSLSLPLDTHPPRSTTPAGGPPYDGVGDRCHGGGGRSIS